MGSRPMTYKRACEALGNGDEAKGEKLIYDEAIDLNAARLKHTSEEWKKRGKQGAWVALVSEVAELGHALAFESDERINAETHNVISVAIRILNREWM